MKLLIDSVILIDHFNGISEAVVREEPRSVGFSDRSDRAERLIECGEEGTQEALQPA
jgi:hypothetical protein